MPPRHVERAIAAARRAYVGQDVERRRWAERSLNVNDDPFAPRRKPEILHEETEITERHSARDGTERHPFAPSPPRDAVTSSRCKPRGFPERFWTPRGGRQG